MLNSVLSHYNVISNRGSELYQAILDLDEQRVNNILGSWLKPAWADVRPEQGVAINLLVAASESPNILRAILVNYPNSLFGSDKLDATEIAATYGNYDSLQILLDSYPSYLFQSLGRSLIGAASHGHDECIRILLERCGSFINADNKVEAFWRASEFCYHNSVRILLEHCNAVISGKHKREAFDNAVKNDRHDVIRVLLEHCRAIICFSSKGRLFWDAVSNDRHEMVSTILEFCNADIGVEDKGRALFEAAKNDRHDLMSVLLEQCSTEITVYYKGEALRQAARNGHHRLVRFFLERCALDVNPESKADALYVAVMNGNLETVNALLEDSTVVAVAHLNDNKALNEALEGLRVDVQRFQPIVDRLMQIPTVIELENFFSVVRNGHHHEVRALLASCSAIINAESKSWALREAASKGKHDVVSAILELCNKDISGIGKKRALLLAAHYGHHDVINLLLEQCSAEFSAHDKGRALEEAARRGCPVSIRFLLEHCSADINQGFKARALCNAIFSRNIETLNALLDDPTVVAAAHLNGNRVLNEAWTDAEHFQPIIDRLMQIPAVAQLANQQHHQGLDLAVEAQVAENSMMALNAPQLRLIGALKKHYKEEYEDKTWDVLSVEIKSYLEDEYSKHPAIDEHGNALPLEFASGLSEASLLAYYQHPAHSAWRYLNHPNLWMSPQAQWVENVEGGRAAIISDSDKALMSYIWLALNDETVKLVEGFTVEGNKILFAQNLSLLGRAHNWDKKRPILDTDGDVKYKPNGKLKREYYDDLEGDKPTCGMGVTQRLLKVFYGHPYVNGPEARNLSAEIMREFMIEHLVKLKSAENEADNLIDRLNTLSVVILKDIHQELSDLLNLYEDYKERELTDDEQTLRTSALTTPEAQLQVFIERCQLWYGETRIKATLPVSFIGHLAEHAGYIPLIQHSLANPIMAFAQKLNEYLKKRVSELESKASRTYLPSSPSSSNSSASCSSAHCVDDSSSAKRTKYDTREEEPRRSKRLRRRQQ